MTNYLDQTQRILLRDCGFAKYTVLGGVARMSRNYGGLLIVATNSIEQSGVIMLECSELDRAEYVRDAAGIEAFVSGCLKSLAPAKV
jgi:hypothetical protein